MNKQLVTSVGVTYVNHYADVMKLMVVGEVFYTRRTRILKRLVRKILHKVEISLDFLSVEEAKAEARRQTGAYVKKYYADR